MTKILARNKEAHYSYEILDTVEAGLVLAGHEVKSVKGGKVSLKGGYVTIRGEEAWLRNVHITPYKFAGDLPGYNPTQDRKLLLKRREINTFIGKSKEQGLTLVPLELIVRRGLVKLVVGVGKGKKMYDKRATIKKREDERRIRRAMRGKR